MWISCYVIALLVILNAEIIFSEVFEAHLRGPGFVMEPPSRLEFSNSSGGWLDCSASGSPQPTIDWQSVDGTSIGDIGGIRRVHRNGTLVLMPFSASQYRQDIHNTIYRCVASNSVGRIISRDVQVRAVVAQAYKVDVEVLGASRGCTAILRCVVPTFVKELVRVVSWVQEPAFYIYPSLQGDGKFHLLPTGELLIHDLDYSDRTHPFRCRTMHRLTRQVVMSSPAKVRITDHRGIISPSVVEHTSLVSVSQDEGAVLLCVAQGCPSPEYRWFTQSGAEPIPVLAGPRIRLLGPILAIEAVTGEDSGTYKCTASSAGGEASAELRLMVSTPIQVEVIPNVLSVHMGGTAEFRCVITSNGSPVSGIQPISWYKNGRQIPSSGETLHVTDVNRDKKGMYQCVVRRPEGDTFQAAAELQLGDAPPSLLYSFIEQTLQPGPAVSLKCSATGNPTPQVSWTLDGFPLPSNGRFMIGQYVTVQGDVISHVNISHVMVEDGGEYACIAENRAGKVTHSARLNIYGLPYIRLIPKVTAVAGETLYLKCPVAGYPIEEIHWERSGRELPEDIRQKVQPDGTLVISPVQKSADSGLYSCWARNKQGHSARRSGEVTVIVPPKLSPFQTSVLQLNMGDRASLTCSVVKGDLPLTISWRKDIRPIDPSLHMSVKQVDQYNSILVIENLGSDHTGNYSCVVKNSAAEVENTQSLLVNVPPRWIVEPTDVNVERNRHVTLHCQAQGVPIPTVVWKKATGTKSGDYEEIRERPYTKLLANGSLYLQHVKEDREGYYLCQANNGIGTGIGKVIQLKVNSSPYFPSPARSVMVKKGDTAILQCEVSGDKPINVVWVRAGSGKQKLDPTTNYKISVKQDATQEGVSAELQIINVESIDSGPYFCQASNLYGRDQQLVQLQVQEPPLPPSALEAAMVTSRSVSLKWQPRSGDSAEVTKYIVEYKEQDPHFMDQWQQIEISDPPQYTTLIENLKPATRYAFRIIAEGTAGQSAPSQELNIKTEPQRPAGPPLNLSIRPLSSTELLITWIAPLSELRHGDIQGYNIGFRTSNSQSSTYNFTSVPGDSDGVINEYLLSGLQKYTRYIIVAQAFNQVGPGPLTDPISAQTMEDVPSRPPEDIRCAALTSQSLQVSWQPPPVHHTNGMLVGYKLTFEPILEDSTNGQDHVETRKTTTLTTVLTGLKKYTNYSIQVLAYTRMGDGVISDSTYCHTEEDAPEAPADIKVVVSSPQSLFISWLPPKEPNGVITKYNLYTRVVNGREELNHEKRNLPSQQLSYEAKNLQAHIEYQFWVSASTRVGEGKSSRVASQVATNRVPARIVSFGGTVVRPWRSTVTLFCQSVGKPKTQWYKGGISLRQGAFHNTQMLETGDLIISNLQVTDQGNYSCQVDNGVGTDRLDHVLVVQVPPSSPVLYVTSGTSSSILMHWKSGANGNSPITGYTLHYRRAQGNIEEMHLSRHLSSHELKGLVCGSTYQVFLTAHNKIGTSPPSTSLHVRTQGQSPGMPSTANLIAPNSTSVVLRLHTWPDNGCPILYFVLQYRCLMDTIEKNWILVSNQLKPQRRFIINGLKPATLYQIKMEAHNVAGVSKIDYQFVTLTKDGEPPPPEIVERGQQANLFYGNVNLLIPGIATISGIICTVALIVMCYKHKTSEDISPYATFQLSEASTLAQPHHTGPANTLLHSFMYHERALTEGCSSPPPAAVLRQLKTSSSPYYNITQKNRRRHSRKTEPESEESESDQDPLTSSRTESSNQLEAAKLKHSIIYHGAQSSTSSDLSPMSEQKSLPRRGRSRYHQQHLYSTNTTPRHSKSSNLNANNITTLLVTSPRSSNNRKKLNLNKLVTNSNAIQCGSTTTTKTTTTSTTSNIINSLKNSNSNNSNLNKKSPSSNKTISTIITPTTISSTQSILLKNSNSNSNLIDSNNLLDNNSNCDSSTQANVCNVKSQNQSIINNKQQPQQQQPVNSIASSIIQSRMPSQFRPIPHKTIPSNTSIIESPTTPTSAKFFSATTLRK
ncbi:cell adhesion molecule Dscam2 isoform X4 [Condylostylus longicornis]|uniref:cell adhesion molecule Dscam2 isoform X4 n=1 Tax=Condylostylus longicornis TaxID=2530218 RepID=UPI00244DC723|nr:cell adhesion molecule Dscam2 isoform X4 [Condylostylus longicornis]